MLQHEIETSLQNTVKQAVTTSNLSVDVLNVPVDLQPTSQNIKHDYTTTFCMRAVKITGTDSYGVFHAIDNAHGFSDFEEQGLPVVWSQTKQPS